MMCSLPPLSSDFLSPSSSSFLSIHTSESQQEFFRMLDEKIEKVRRRVFNVKRDGANVRV